MFHRYITHVSLQNFYMPDSIESVVVFPALFVTKTPKHPPAWTEEVSVCTATLVQLCIPPERVIFQVVPSEDYASRWWHYQLNLKVTLFHSVFTSMSSSGSRAKVSEEGFNFQERFLKTRSTVLENTSPPLFDCDRSQFLRRQQFKAEC